MYILTNVATAIYSRKIYAFYTVHNFSALKPFLLAFGQLFSFKKWEGMFIREEAFIRINTVKETNVFRNNPSLLTYLGHWRNRN